jgi:hypothetical protein
MNTTTLPDGYLKDAQGRLVPRELVKDIDLARDELVGELVDKAHKVQQSLTQFKRSALGDIQAFVELSAERYGAKLGGNKGNVTLMSYDGRYKVQRSVNEYITFDERLQVAKELVDECIHEWVQGSRPEIKALVEDAFQTDKQGKISTSRVLGLKRLNIPDETWQQAMQAITDSIQITGSTTYIRLYERIGDSEQFRPIPLDIAAL